jgi:hypothetical protein
MDRTKILSASFDDGFGEINDQFALAGFGFVPQ